MRSKAPSKSIDSGLLDSRAIGPGDCFARKLSREGLVKYRVLLAPGHRTPILGDTYTISVRETADPTGAPLRHAIGVRRQGSRLVVDQPALIVARGDTVVWFGKSAAVEGFVVKGIYGDRVFDSSRLRSDAMYTHAFGAPGEYRWVDAHGSDIGGTLTVRSDDEVGEQTRSDAARARLKGTIIRVRANGAEPRHVELLTGQTVFWSVDDAPGISITDARLLENEGALRQGRGKTYRMGRRAS